LTRVRNAQMVGKANCTMPSSGVKAEIARVLQEEGYITSFEVGGLSFLRKMVVKKLEL